MVVRMRNNRAQSKERRSHHALKEPTLSTCGNCGDLHRPHHMCLSCGFYKGRQVLDLEAQNQKRADRIKAKEERINGEQATPGQSADIKDEGATGDVTDEVKKIEAAVEAEESKEESKS